MEKSEKREELNQILSCTVSWIENCDSKSSIILGCIGVIAGILMASDYISKFVTIFKSFTTKITFGSVIYLFLTGVSLCAVAVGCLFLLWVLVAKINPKEFEGKGVRTDSLLFFTSIANNKTIHDYKMKLKSMKDDALEDDLISQIYICSIICSKKFKRYKIGLLLSALGSISFAIMIIIGIIVM